MTTLLAFVGRLMIALLFLVSGANKLMDISGTDTMIRAAGLPGGLALITGLFEVIAGLALVFGVLTRFFAVLLAGFCLLAALFFHNNVADPMQAANFLKNIAIAGGLLSLTALDSIRWSFDAMRARRRAEVAEVAAEHRAHDAEVRAARAEGEATARSAFGKEPVVAGDGTVARHRRWI
ncbi:MAG TPA: DoxX family protein [Novosphingobium sp.]